MPKSQDQKNIEAIARTIRKYNFDYDKIPLHVRSQLRNAYQNLSPGAKERMKETYPTFFGDFPS